jgi:2-phospho-L-lactate guanylyltransferase (CobY/MobA/RfbA family)
MLAEPVPYRGLVHAPGWSAVVPLKEPASAKQRLAGLGDWRPTLAVAFATDVISALLGSADLREVIVVGGDGLAPQLLAAPRVRKVADVRGLNEAVDAGVAAACQSGHGRPSWPTPTVMAPPRC